ncbi:MAG TPA: TerB family tellurite resistance protein [Thermoanaerobaculia bacterium]
MLRRLFGVTSDSSGAAGTASTPSPDSVREIADALDRLDPNRARYLAAFAYILGRVAHVDLEVTAEETRQMERILQRLASLSEAEAILIVRIAKSQHQLFGATESYVVTREFARSATREEKEVLLECLFAVSASDGAVSGVEEAEIRRVAGELDLSHDDFIAARSKFREHIAVLKRTDRRES